MNIQDKTELHNVINTYGVDVVLEEMANLFRGGPVTAVEPNNPAIVKHAKIAAIISKAVSDIDNLHL